MWLFLSPTTIPSSLTPNIVIFVVVVVVVVVIASFGFSVYVRKLGENKLWLDACCRLLDVIDCVEVVRAVPVIL
jgi:hypothetical protein